MSLNFCVFKFLIVLSLIINISYQKVNEIISNETVEINEVIDSASKEDFGKSHTIKDTRKTNVKRVVDKDLSKQPNSTVKTQVNVSSYNCQEKMDSSSEESQCMGTLVTYPFSVSIQKKGAHYASGALIHKRHVITSAEEFYNVREIIKLFRVRLGSVDCKKGGIVLPIKLVEVHPQFIQGLPIFDVALVRLSRAVETTEFIKPLPLSTVQHGVVSAKFLTTYWPRLIINGELLPKTAKERLKHHNMRVSKQKLIPWKDCAIMMKAREAVLDENSLCLRPIATHHSICTPDVGAPVVADDGLWGITSGWTAEQCSKYPSPTVFTRTNMKPVRLWVKSVIESVAA